MKSNNLSLIPSWILLLSSLLINQTALAQSEYHTVHSSDGTPIGFTKIGSGPIPIVFVH